jgi:BirA family biotin operon repressor/biotin-[acetyl-CoA-carboxylase] ligase
MSPVAAPSTIVRVGRVDSTQAVAFALAADGAADGTVVVADSQVAGRGRRGRPWVDEPGASLLVSIVLRPRLEPARLSGLSLAAGVAVAGALTRTAGLTARLKWPNDVLVDGRKIAGILPEASTGRVRLGIGFNVNQTEAELPEETVKPTTSLQVETGKDWDRGVLLAAILLELETRYDAWQKR